MAYATVTEVEARMVSPLTTTQRTVCATLLEDAAVVIDAYNSNAATASKKVVSCNMVIRAIGNSDGMPIGANQGTTSALGYSQTWTFSQGSVGELYLTKLDKKLLGCSSIGSGCIVETLVGGSR